MEEFAIRNASKELIPETGGDAIFVTIFGPEEESTEQEITGDPLWQKLEAVQQGRVYEVSDDLWMLGIGYTAANGVLDDLREHLMGSKTDVEHDIPGTLRAEDHARRRGVGVEFSYPVDDASFGDDRKVSSVYHRSFTNDAAGGRGVYGAAHRRVSSVQARPPCTTPMGL